MVMDSESSLRPPSASIVPHALLYVIQVVALVLPPFKARKYIFGSLIAGLGVYAHLHPHFTNYVQLAQPFTIGWSYYMATLAKLLFSHSSTPEGNFWRIDRSQGEALGFAALSWNKFRWALMLIFNQRGIRWNHQVKNVPRVAGTTNAKFLALRAWDILSSVLAADLLFQLSQRLFFTDAHGVGGDLRSSNLTLRHPDWRWSFTKAFVFGATPYFMLSMQYAQLSLVAVALGLSKPEDWPPPFGSLRDATTVRAFWGKYWHQQLRHMLTTYTDAFIDALGIPRGTNWSSYTTLYLAFGISGFFHALSQLQMPCPMGVSDRERTLGFFLFFAWQAAAITVEDGVTWVWKRYIGMPKHGSGRRMATVAGYIWVTWSMWTSMPLVGDTFLRMRMGEESFLPFTISGPLVAKLVPKPP